MPSWTSSGNRLTDRFDAAGFTACIVRTTNLGGTSAFWFCVEFIRTAAANLQNYARSASAPDVFLVCIGIYGIMNTYTILQVDDGAGFNIGVLGANGARQTILGFKSQAEANAWIVQDKRIDHSTELASEDDLSIDRAW